jgi:hypothetical protein
MSQRTLGWTISLTRLTWKKIPRWEDPKKSPCLESWPCLCPDASFFEWISCVQWVHPQKKRLTVLGNVGTELYAWCTSFYYNDVYLDVCTCT